MEFIRRRSDCFEHRGVGPGLPRADHRMDQVFGMFDEVERPPGGIDQGPGHLHEMGSKKLAKPPGRRQQRLIQSVGDHLEKLHRVGIGVDVGRQVAGHIWHGERTEAGS